MRRLVEPPLATRHSDRQPRAGVTSHNPTTSFATPPAVGDRVLLGVVTVLLCFWAWLCSAYTFVHVGDEGIYLYDGWLVAHGQLPYRDFFLAHPPVRVLLSAGLFGLGLPAVAGKALAMLATATNTVLIAALARRISGPWAGSVAALLWMGGALSLETGTYYLGSNLAATIMLSACVAAAYGRFAWAGALLGIGAHQALYALLPGPVLLWWAWRRGATRRFVLGGMTWPAGVLLAWAVFGDAYWVQTVAYHLRKVSGPPKPWPVHRIAGFLRADWAAVSLALAAWLGRAPATRFLAALAWQCLLVVCLYRSLQGYYFILPLTLLCAAGGAGVVQLGHLVASQPTLARRRVPVTAAIFLIFWGLSAIPNVHAAITRRAFLPVVDAELAELARKISANPPRQGTLWGDTSVTPVLALRTGLPIAANFVDTNDQRFDSGLATAADVQATVLAGYRPGVLMIARHGVYRVAAIRHYVERNFLAQFIFQGHAMGYDVVYLLPAPHTRPAQPAQE